MGTVLWNERPLRLGAAFAQPRDEDFPVRNFKHSSVAFVREFATSYVRGVLDAVELEGEHRYAVVDVRVTTIRAGKREGILGWHMDTVGDPAHATRPEVHHLLVTGTASLTEFVAGPVRLELPDGMAPHALMRVIDKELAAIEVATVRVPSCRIVTYGRFDLHRASVGERDERRLLVRVTETDVIRPYDRL